MFGLERFASEAMAAADAEYAARKASPDPEVAGSDLEYLKIDLGFEETVQARKQLLERSFYRGRRT